MPRQECIVLLHGQLRGMGREEGCDLLARRKAPEEGTGPQMPVEYSDCVILNAPADLPDGDYILLFAGHSIVAARVHGLWASIGTAARDKTADRLGAGRTVDPGAMALPRTDERKKAEPGATIRGQDTPSTAPRNRVGSAG